MWGMKGVSHDILTCAGKSGHESPMPRQVRIEFAGAFYHVMARGDRREPIVRDEEDRRTFLRTLGEGCERAGFGVHAYVLMTNHYHLLLETKEPNLSRGMAWLQNAFTRRINTRHRLWGHVFGGRYKAILVEPGNCFWALLDYIHLNAVRAGLVKAGDGLDSYPWSSLCQYIAVPKMRLGWQETKTAFTVTGAKTRQVGGESFLKCWRRGWIGRTPARRERYIRGKGRSPTWRSIRPSAAAGSSARRSFAKCS